MNCENYVKFVKDFRIFKMASQDIKFKHQIKDDVGNSELYFSAIENGINKAQIFEVDDEETIYKLLAISKNPNENEELHLPFNVCFIDVQFTKEQLAELGIEIKSNKITGIMFQIGSLMDFDTKKTIGKDLRITIYTKDDTYLYFHTIYRGLSKSQNDYLEKNGLKFNTDDKFYKDFDFVYKFIINFLNFVNNPEVELIIHERSEKNNQRKIQRGEIPIPSSTKIKLTGKLKIYINEVQKNEWFSKYSYSFWVKGHFRSLISPRFKEKKRLWIFPFIKGKGQLITKTYEVKSQ